MVRNTGQKEGSSKKWIAFLITGCLIMGNLLTACSGNNTSETTSSTETGSADETDSADGTEVAGETESTDETEQTPVGDMWLNSDILGVVTENTEVSEKDDYASAANQEWLAQARIPDGYSSYGAFTECNDLLKERKMELIGNPSIESHNEELVTQFYQLATDWESRNNTGISAAEPYIDVIKEIGTVEELTEYLCDTDKNLQQDILGGIYIGTLSQDSSKYMVGIDQMTYLYPYPEDYEELSAYGEMVDTAERAIASYVLQKFGWTEEEAEAAYESCIDFEGAVMQYAYTEEELSSPELVQMTRNECSWDELEKQQGDFPMTKILESLGYEGSDVYNVADPELFQHMGDFYNEENLDSIKNYLFVHTALMLGVWMDQDTYEYCRDINNQVYGIEGTLSNEEYGYTCVSKYLPYVIDYLYLDQWCTDQMQDDALQMVEDFKSILAEILTEEDWLSDVTKEKAIEKLEAVEAKAVYPEKRFDYSGLDLSDCDTYIDAIIRISEYDEKREKEKINGQVDRDYWEMESSVCNAYYDPTQNTIVILAGIMLPPLYSEDMSYEEKLGCLGETIGHELSHAFDTSGAQYDKDGNLVSWWTEQDYQAFQDRAQKVVKYMDRITPDNGSGEPVNGSRVQAEMIADLGGTKAALRIAAKSDEFDYDAFFKMHALQWRNVMSKEVQQSMMATDGHPLDYLRTNVVLQQFQEFYTTYDIQPGDGMYLAPELRLEVW
jgi:putative endopeptidase